MLSDLSPDLVCIATRTPESPALVEPCLEHGVRRLHLEIPLCRSAAELSIHTDQLLNTGSHCTFGALRRYLSPYLQAHALLHLGHIGCLREVQVALGSGQLCWTQIHSIDLIAAFLAPASITEVRATAETDSFSTDGYLLDGDPVLCFATFITSEGP